MEMTYANVARLEYDNRIISAVSFALLYYDFVLTLPLEIEKYWRRRTTWASALFFANRYVSVLSHVPVIYEYFFTLSEAQLQLYHAILAAAVQGFVALLLTLRTYALFNCDRNIFYTLGGVLVVGGIISLWAIGSTLTTLHFNPATGTGVPAGETRVLQDACITVLSQSQGEHYAIAWSTMLLFDMVVFALTIARTVKLGLAWRRGLFYVIMRDGSIYFGILLVCYLSNVVTFVHAAPGYQGFLATLTNVFSSTLVSRMMLNLRVHHDAHVDMSYSALSPRFDVQFAPADGRGDESSAGGTRASVSGSDYV